MKGLDFLDDTKGVVILAGVALAAYLGWTLYKKAPALPTPANATNADGTPQTGYVGAGVVGVVGAATNAASGGLLSSLGDSIGSGLYSLFGSDPNADANAAQAVASSSNPLTGSNVGLQANDAATALYSNPIDYGTPGDF